MQQTLHAPQRQLTVYIINKLNKESESEKKARRNKKRKRRKGEEGTQDNVSEASSFGRGFNKRAKRHMAQLRKKAKIPLLLSFKGGGV